jgi:hypothetical protein
VIQVPLLPTTLNKIKKFNWDYCFVLTDKKTWLQMRAMDFCYEVLFVVFGGCSRRCLYSPFIGEINSGPKVNKLW